jgi:hypothetical protein
MNDWLIDWWWVIGWWKDNGWRMIGCLLLSI